MSTLRISLARSWRISEDGVFSVEVVNRCHESRFGTIALTSPLEIDVPPELYLVRVSLPDGETISTNCQVGPEETSVQLVDDAPAPVQMIVTHGQSTESEEGSDRKRVSYPRIKLGGHARPRAIRFTRRSQTPSQGHKGGYKQRKELWGRFWVHTDQGWQTKPWPGDIRRVTSTDSYEMDLSTHRRKHCAVQVLGAGYRRRVLVVPPSDKIRFRIEVVRTPVTHSKDPRFEPHVTIESDDGVSESLLKYLWTGQLTAAQPLGAKTAMKAEKMLQDKLVDPRGAAVAGYYLLRIGAYERLHEWPNNFADWIAWLPDSAIIHAWQIIRDPGREDYERVLSRLLQAEKAGIPVYTEGLRLLYDGLRLFAEEDQEAAKAAVRVARYIRAMITMSPLTEVYGHGPASPDPSVPPDEPPYQGAVPLFVVESP